MVRLMEFQNAGITAATVTRLERDGKVIRLARGLYQLPDAKLHQHHTLAEAAQLVPKGVICLASALAYHGLTDQMPSKVWMAIGRKDWRPRVTYPPITIVRFAQEALTTGVELHEIEGTSVRIFSVAKTVADLFRYKRSVGDSLAIEGLREALRQKKVKPAEIARCAERAGVWKRMEPYVAALTSHA
jgi:predicted transcriptional regulator of viral defense system